MTNKDSADKQMNHQLKLKRKIAAIIVLISRRYVLCFRFMGIHCVLQTLTAWIEALPFSSKRIFSC